MVAVSVVIVNANGASLLEDCLKSLDSQTFKDFEVIFVDNGSTDDSIERVKQLMPRARILPQPTNTGFALGNNLGMREARGEYIVLLNNDVRVAPGFLEELVAVVHRDPRIGMVAPKILSFFETGRIDSVGGLVLCPDGLAQGRGRGEIDHGQYDDLEQVLIPSGCAALYRTAMLREIGLFDEGFFMYCEDTDLGLRGLWAGWKTFSAPRSVVYHKYSGFSSPYSPFKMYLVERNHYWMATKNFPGRRLIQVPFWTLYRYLLMAAAVLTGKGKGQAGNTRSLLWAFIRGHAAALLKIPNALRHRIEIRKIETAEFCRLLQEHRLDLAEMMFKP